MPSFLSLIFGVSRMKSALIASLVLATLGPMASFAQEATFRAGAATSNITPALGSSLNGGMTDRKASNIHDELHARCLVLDDGKTRLAFAVCDVCMIPREIVQDAKKRIEDMTQIPASNVLISATHSHSCPTCAGVFQSETVPGYPEFLARRIADGVARAVKNLAPAQIAWGKGKNDQQVFNRRWLMKPGTIPPDPFGNTTDQARMNPPVESQDLIEPAGPIDPDVSILTVRSPEGRPIALLGNYSLHYVGGTGPGEVSADYFGAFADRIQQLLEADRLDPPFVGILSNGTSGDINNINFRKKPDRDYAPYEKLREVANDIATESARVFKSLSFANQATLAALTKEIQLGVRKPSADDLDRARSILEEAGDEPLTSLAQIYARETVLLNDYPDTVPVTIQALRIGNLAIVAIPCEVFVEIGLEIKEKSPFAQTFTIELANGYNGYLPTERHHQLGGYETWRARSSYLEVNAARAITDTAIDLLKQLAPAPKPAQP